MKHANCTYKHQKGSAIYFIWSVVQLFIYLFACIFRIVLWYLIPLTLKCLFNPLCHHPVPDISGLKNRNLSQYSVSMRNEYFIYNQFIKIKYKIISKQKRKKKKHCTRHWYDTNDRININNYSYIQCKKLPLVTFFPWDCTVTFQNFDVHYNTKISTIKKSQQF